ncbi:MAG TPA: BatA and WFA domain-containing protein [Polyangiaceae bacterium]|nr:BatA and WFA domain-containing protein [Polyangiaceae bacterium]HNZ24973.1 BatA and WFA domain-containing protein [Polyangiaceae bacterium]HOD25267.1 BatA and WFA domain-containing protein [Polyangiaceae bacterium]HOE50304.1 BatA and WFA domain-containing protein [Polyangiaceae bacterium]HOH02794.1 BatA and WFA domain-containing protein [Polyangiaceae bacterium]
MTLPFEFLNPAGLWMLSALAPLIVLYILKIKRQRLRVPSTWLWVSAQRDLLAKSPFQRLTPQIPLFLQILIILLLSLALARPSTRSEAISGDHLALVIDTSASMSALDESGKTRLELAKASALRVIDALGPSSDAMVLEAGHDARIASPMDRDRRRLQAAIEMLQTSDTEGDLGTAVALAVDRLRQLGGQVRVIVFTDGALAHPDSLSSVSIPMQLVKVGSTIDNAAIVRVDVRRGRDAKADTDQVQVFAMLANYGTRARESFVTLRQHNASDVLASRKVLLQPGEKAPVVLSFEAVPGDIGQGLLVQLSPADAMPVDDVAYARVPPGEEISVIGLGKRSPWIERAFRSDPNVAWEEGSVSDLESGAIPPGALVVIEGQCPTVLPPGDMLILNPPEGPCLTTTVKGLVDKPMITSWATADQRFRFLTLDGVLMEKARLLGVDNPRHELIHAREGAIAADVSLPGRTVTLVGFDVGDTNWPYKASFVLFVRNLVELARTHRSHGVVGAGKAGEPVRLAVPHHVQEVKVVGPGEVTQSLRARDGLAIVPSTQKAGINHASWGKPIPGSVVFAINLTSENESDVRDKPLEFTSSDVKTTTAEQVSQSHTEWSWLLAVLALAAVITDVWYLTRKPRFRSLSATLQPKRPERTAT